MTPIDEAIIIKDQAFDVSRAIIDTITAKRPPPATAILALALTVAKAFRAGNNIKQTREFFNGAVDAALKDMAIYDEEERQKATLQ